MTTQEQGNVVYHGPMAEHDVTCPIYGCPNKAVLEFGSPGIFQPCWKCQEKYGFKTVKMGKIARWWFRDVLKRIY